MAMHIHMKNEKAVAAMVSAGRRSLARCSNAKWMWMPIELNVHIIDDGICRCRSPSMKHPLSIRSMATRAADLGGSSLSSFNEEMHFRPTKNTDIKHSPSPSSQVKISMDELLALASCHPTPLSLADMYRYGDKPSMSAKGDNDQFVDVVRLRNAQFLHRELPIRIAQRSIDLLTLPHGLNRTREVQSVANTYLQVSFT
jgi:hypothetical protein